MTERVTDSHLAEWKAVAEKATAGDWKVETPAPSKKRRKPSRFVECVLTEGNFAGLKAVIAQVGNPHDRDLIAASRTAVPSLISEVERLREALEEAISDIYWMSAASDFGPDGQAHNGWVKVREKTDRARALLSPK